MIYPKLGKSQTSVNLLDSLLTKKIPTSVLGVGGPREFGSYPKTLDVNEEGYPSSSKVNEISLIGFRDSFNWMCEEFPKLWKELPYTSCSTSESSNGKHLIIKCSTGGWSGAEQVLEAMLEHYMFAAFCTTISRGGHYTFEVPVNLHVSKS